MCIRSFNHERHDLKIYVLFHISDIQCYVFFFGENGVFLDFYPWIQPRTHKKTPGILYTIGFKILSRLWITNFQLPKMTWEILIML